jgi:hypothetical protein
VAPTTTPTATATATATAEPLGPLDTSATDAPPTLLPQSSLLAGPFSAGVDRTAPHAVVVGGTAARPARVTLLEPATVNTRLKRGTRVIERTFTLAAGKHTLTPRRLAGRAKLQRGRYTLTVRVRDAAGNAAPVRVLRFTV